jgi:putative transposase
LERVVSMEWERKTWMEEYETGESISEIARRHQVSRKALYKWIQRYQEGGPEGLGDRRRAPHQHPNQVAEIWRERVRAVRQQHPHWGPYKLRPLLNHRYGSEEVPSASTIQRILQEMGMIQKRRRILRAKGSGPLWDAQEPNEVWAVDFKGWCRVGNGTRCEPLTLMDQATRYLLCCRGLDSTRTELVRPVMERVFREHGMPERIRSDNGPPFGSNGACGLTELSVWWIELGVECERIRPGHPQENGRHERMHRTLQEATMESPATTLRKQQARFDAFCREYNEERVHEGLGLATPTEVYQASPRAYPERVAEPAYDKAWEVRKVQDGGRLRWSSYRLFVSHALAGKYVGFEPVGEDLWRLWFYRHWLGIWETRERRLWRPAEIRSGTTNEAVRDAALSSPKGIC